MILATLAASVGFSFSPLPAHEAARVYFSACKPDAPYVVAPDAAVDLGHFTLPPSDCDAAASVFREALSSSGLHMVSRSGVYVIAKRQTDQEAQDAPPVASVYVPQHRDPVELSAALRGLLPGLKVSAPDDTAAFLALSGSQQLVTEARAVLAELDRPVHQYRVELAVIEYQDRSTKDRSVSGVVSALSGRFSVSIGNQQPALGSRIEVSTGDLDAVLAALDDSGSFRSVSRPSLLVRDGTESTIFNGEERRVPGSVSIDAQGNPIQSLESVQAGSNLTVSVRTVHEGVVIDLNQELSQFIGRDTNGGTRSTRSVSGTWTARPGTTYVLGGGQSELESLDRSGLFGFTLGTARRKSSGQLLVLLTLTPA